jgi:hypothetical protein
VAEGSDGNLGTVIRSDRYGYRDDFLSVSDIYIRPELRWIQNDYFFSPTGNPTGT